MHPVPAHSSSLSARGCAPALHGAASPAQRTAGECANIDYAEKIHNCQMRLTPPTHAGTGPAQSKQQRINNAGARHEWGWSCACCPQRPGAAPWLRVGRRQRLRGCEAAGVGAGITARIPRLPSFTAAPFRAVLTRCARPRGAAGQADGGKGAERERMFLCSPRPQRNYD